MNPTSTIGCTLSTLPRDWYHRTEKQSPYFLVERPVSQMPTIQQ